MRRSVSQSQEQVKSREGSGTAEHSCAAKTHKWMGEEVPLQSMPKQMMRHKAKQTTLTQRPNTASDVSLHLCLGHTTALGNLCLHL